MSQAVRHVRHVLPVERLVAVEAILPAREIIGEVAAGQLQEQPVGEHSVQTHNVRVPAASEQEDLHHLRH